jgi:hypothetical protein
MPQVAFTNRYEIKYLVETRRIDEIKEQLSDFFEPDPYSVANKGYYVYSIYYDSPSYKYYSEKREGQLTRIKPRLRTYLPTPEATPETFFLELKGRHGQITLKRREKIGCDLAQALLRPSRGALSPRELESPTLSEFTFLADRYNLLPCVTVLYRREPFNAAFYPGLRLTFDTLLQCSFRTRFNNPQHAFAPAIPFNYFVLELKYNDRIPRIFIERLRQLELNQQPVSKFAVSLESCYGGLQPRRYAL